MPLFSPCLLRSTNLPFTLGRLFSEPPNFQVRNYAARKGTRERRLKKKVKVEEVKVGFIPHNQRDKEKMLALRPKLKFDDSYKGTPIDNVYTMKYYKWIVYPFQEAVKCHKETHHPSMYNVPNANLHVSIELNMQGEKKTRFVDNFTRIVGVPNSYDHGEDRSIIVFGKDLTALENARNMGAQLAGGVELIKQIQNGALSLNDFKYVIAHPDILPELVALRGLMRRKFPNPKNGTLDVDIVSVVNRYLNGISYTATKDEYEKDFGLIQTILGTLDMSTEHLEDNFKALIRDVYSMKPRREGEFIRRCLVWSPPSQEKLKIDHERYIEDKKTTKKIVEQADEEDVGERVAL